MAILLLPGDSGGESAADIVARYSQGSDGYLRAAVAEGVSVGLLVIFVAGLHGAVARADEGARTLSRAAAIGATAALTLLLLGFALIATLAYRTAADADADVVIALYDLSSLAGQFGLFALVVFLFANGAVMVRTGAVSRRLGYAALGLGALSVVAAGGLEQHGILSVHDGLGFLALALVYVWVLAASVLLLRRARRSRHARRHDIRAANSSV